MRRIGALAIIVILLFCLPTTASSARTCSYQSSRLVAFHAAMPTDKITSINASSDNQILIVRISSSHDIAIQNMTYSVNTSTKGAQVTMGAAVAGLFLANRSTILKSLMTGAGEGSMPGSLLYLRFGRYIIDKRNIQEYNRTLINDGRNIKGFVLPPGNWSFILYGGIYDLRADQTQVHSQITINISDIPDDFQSTVIEKGRYIGLWYGQFNAPFMLDKTDTCVFLFGGHVRFTINDTFLFNFDGGPAGIGAFKIKWVGPQGINKCRALCVYQDWLPYGKEDQIFGCVQNIGPSGVYTLRLNYIDLNPKDIMFTYPPFFTGLDVPVS
jgi:hypothetical protein